MFLSPLSHRRRKVNTKLKAWIETGINNKDDDQGKGSGKNVEGNGPHSECCTLMKRKIERK